jgi:alginate O-acetyltransferase complex protein AlgI
MVFSSLIFLFLFLPVVLSIYFFLRNETARNAFLLAASLIFYAWGEPTYLCVMLVSIVANYMFAIWIEDRRPAARRILAIAVTFNLLLLGFFKYCTFVLANLNHVLSFFGQRPIAVWSVPLPLGVSFFTFHALSYVIDVFRKQAIAQRRPINLALYICFFPQLIAGPIIRYHDICDQLNKRTVTSDLFSEGIKRFIGGLGKKVLIANVLAKPADLIFSVPPGELSFGVSWIAPILYALQVYFDFSGYSDMAIGLALMFGFRFPENFNYPYISQSMTELWNRWHISLSNWFRDYLFRPLGGFRRNNKLHTSAILIIIFFCIGLWHGASWHFVIWGLYNGLFVSIERLGLGRILNRIWRPFRHLYVLVVWLFGVVLFRSDNLAQAQSLWFNMLCVDRKVEGFYSLPVILNSDICLAIMVGVLVSTPLFSKLLVLLSGSIPEVRPAGQAALNLSWSRWSASLQELRMAPQLMLEVTVLVLVVVQLSSGAYNPFIYFRF